MKRGWRIIFGIAVVAVIVGALCFGVGMFTGADMERIVQNVNNQFHLDAYLASYTDYIGQLFQFIKNLF